MAARKKLELSTELKVCKRALENYGVGNIKINTRSETGYPDRMFLIPGGRPLFIEFKREGEEPSKKQLYIHEGLRALGYDVEVHDDVDAALWAIVRRMPGAGGQWVPRG